MSETKRSMGPVLAELGGGAVFVTLKREDFNIVNVMSPDGKPMAAPAKTLIVIQAQRYRAFPKADDIWEFRVAEPTEAGMTTALIYVHGEDILCVKIASKVAV